MHQDAVMLIPVLTMNPRWVRLALLWASILCLIQQTLGIVPAITSVTVSTTLPARIDQKYSVSYTLASPILYPATTGIEYRWMVNDTRGNNFDLGLSTDIKFITSSMGFGKGDQIYVRVRIVDNLDGTFSTMTSKALTLVNSPPEIRQLVVYPLQPTTQSLLTCNVTQIYDVDDPSGPFTFAYTWILNNAQLAGQTQKSLSSAYTSSGDTVACSAKATDSSNATSVTVTSGRVTVVRTVPQVTNVTVSPNYNGDSRTDFTCQASPLLGLDAKFLSELRIGFQWRKVAAELTTAQITSTPNFLVTNYKLPQVSSLVTTSSLLSSHFLAKGDRFFCMVVVNDTVTAYASEPKFSPLVTVGDAKPLVSTVSFDPASPSKSLPTSCYVSQAAISVIDLTKLNISYTPANFSFIYKWTVNGINTENFTIPLYPTDTEARSSSLPPQFYKKNDILTCSAAAAFIGLQRYDATTMTDPLVWPYGPFSTPKSVVVGNAAPYLTEVRLRPVGSPLTAVTCVSSGAGDPDGDALVNTRYEWYKNDILMVSNTGPSVTSFSREDILQCAMTVSDGLATSTKVFSSQLSLDAPYILSINVTDVDNLDNFYSDGDMFTIVFDQNTDRAGYAVGQTLNKTAVDALFDSAAKLGRDYTGVWFSSREFQITVTDARNNTIQPRVGSAVPLYFETKSTGNIRNAASTSIPSLSLSPVLSTGNFGNAPALFGWGSTLYNPSSALSGSDPAWAPKILPFEALSNPSGSASMTRASVVSVCAGQDHVLVVDNAGAVYGMGDNAYGQLGASSTASPATLRPILLGGGVRAAKVACGALHSLIITSTGLVLSAGDNRRGQLGRTGVSTTFSQVILPGATGHVAVSVAASAKFSFVATNKGEVFAFGAYFNATGYHGLNGGSFPVQQITAGLQGLFVKEVACGSRHVLVLTNDGRVFSWGSNSLGQTGHSVRAFPLMVAQPRQLSLFYARRSIPLAEVSRYVSNSTLYYDSTIALVEIPLSLSDITNGGTTPMRTELREMVEIAVLQAGGRSIFSLAAGDYHSLLVSTAGELYCFGRNADAQCGMWTDEYVVEYPQLVSLLSPVAVRAVAGGPTYSLLGDAEGNVFSMGFNDQGALGLPSEHAEFPTALASSYALSTSSDAERSVTPSTTAPPSMLSTETDGKSTSNNVDGSLNHLFDKVRIVLLAAGSSVALAASKTFASSCLHDCNNHGLCVEAAGGVGGIGEGTCLCAAQSWVGPTCAIPVCAGSPPCQGRGSCEVQGSKASCVCQEGFWGHDCGNVNCTMAPYNGCSGHGECAVNLETGVGVRCSCDLGWGGMDCSTCALGWKSGNCSVSDCSLLDNCNKRGNCTVVFPQANGGFMTAPAKTSLSSLDTNGALFKCVCDGWSGDTCLVPDCRSDLQQRVCGGHGVCEVGNRGPACQCNPGWSGTVCNVTSCAGSPQCGGPRRGTCGEKDGQPFCSCLSPWAGKDCSLGSCASLNDCTGHGICSTAGTAASPSCVCESGWSGGDCSSPDGSSDSTVTLLVVVLVLVLLILLGSFFYYFYFYTLKNRSIRKPRGVVDSHVATRPRINGYFDSITIDTTNRPVAHV